MAVESDDDRRTFLADFGELLTYTHGGATVPLLGIVEMPVTVVAAADGPDRLGVQPIVLFAEADLSAGYAQGDALVMRGKTWRVRAVLPDGAGMVRMELEAA